MYIHYRIVNGIGITWDDKKDFQYPWSIPLPSESTWIVPGTVDPKED